VSDSEDHRARAEIGRLADTLRLLEKSFANLSEAVLVIKGDDFRTVVEANRAAEIIFGWSREELMGRSTAMLHVSRDRFESFGAGSQEVLLQGGTYRASFPMRRRDGTVFEAQQTVTLLDLEAGLAGGAVSVVRDVSEQALAERKLRESEERFRKIAVHVQDVFWVMSPDGRTIEYVSPAFERVWGRDPRAILDDRSVWLESIHPDDVERVREAVSRQREGGYDEEYRIVTPDGSVRWIWDRAFPVRDETGAVHHVLGVAGDITHRRDLQERLQQAQKMEAVGRLAGGIAHDFNNLLTVVVGQSDLLLLELPEGSEWAEEVELIRTAAERGAELTKQLLAFSREQLLRPRLVDISDVVAPLERLLDRLLGQDVRLVVELADELPRVRVDPTQLEQVLLNLATNARDSMPEGGVLTVRSFLEEVDRRAEARWPGLTPGPRVTVTFADTGVGMDDGTLLRIFEPFFTTRRDRGGTGLGLATSYGIVKQSGGTIHAESEPGKGTTFYVRFPPAESDAPNLGDVTAGSG
jgi:two-component system, cell cycle sensor histidine kinase and response regulator CckA